MNRLTKSISLVLGAASLVVAIDQCVKRLVMGSFALGESRTVIPGLLDLSYHQNTGAAFSLFHNAPTFVLILLTFVVLGIFGFLIYPQLTTRIGMAAAALIMGGAVGNLWDRIRLHYVVDFFDLHVWPVFNIADIAVVIGVILMMLNILISDRKRSAALPGGDHS